MPQNDEFGRHELLDRTHLAMEFVQDHICNHGGIKGDELALADAALSCLGKLYQKIGAEHLEK